MKTSWLGWIAALAAVVCTPPSSSVRAAGDLTLVASTPCDAEIRTVFSIAPERKCDFIRWTVTVDSRGGASFNLAVEFGEARPNTPGFVDAASANRRGPYDGELFEIRGSIEISRRDGREVWRLRGTGSRPFGLTLAKVSENVFHILNSEGRMMVGNGGWSYTLNSSAPTTSDAASTEAPKGGGQARVKTIFDGRTPCAGLRTYFTITPACTKVKFRLTLYRDPRTLEPTTFKIDPIRVPEERAVPIEGRWKIVDGNVYRLEAPRPVSFLAIDDVLLFLDAEGRPLIGDKHFSYTLNRRSDLE